MEHERNRFTVHTHLTLVFVALTGGAVLMGLAEIAARAFFPESVPATERVAFFRYDDTLGWAHRPGLQAQFTQRDFSIDVAISAQGLRDRFYSFPRGDKRRLLVIGDSFGWGFGVEEEQRFSEIIERTHPDWEVINASVNGYGTDQEYLYLKADGLRFRPDVVLLLFHPNDYENNVRTEQYWYFKPRFKLLGSDLVLGGVPVPRATLVQRLKRFVLGRTYLGTRVLSLWRSLWSGQDAGSKGTDAVDARDARYEITARLIQAVDSVCAAAGARLVISSVPMAAPDRRHIGDATVPTGTSYLPLDSAFSAAGPGVTFPNDEHWSAYGHAVAATAIEEFLVREGILGGISTVDDVTASGQPTRRHRR